MRSLTFGADWACSEAARYPDHTERLPTHAERSAVGGQARIGGKPLAQRRQEAVDGLRARLAWTAVGGLQGAGNVPARRLPVDPGLAGDGGSPRRQISKITQQMQQADVFIDILVD